MIPHITASYRLRLTDSCSGGAAHFTIPDRIARVPRRTAKMPCLRISETGYRRDFQAPEMPPSGEPPVRRQRCRYVAGRRRVRASAASKEGHPLRLSMTLSLSADGAVSAAAAPSVLSVDAHTRSATRPRSSGNDKKSLSICPIDHSNDTIAMTVCATRSPPWDMPGGRRFASRRVCLAAAGCGNRGGTCG